MPKYEHVIPKTGGIGYAQDPPQDIPNAGSGVLDKEISVRNGLALSLGYMYGKKVVTSGVNAIVEVSGNKQWEKGIEMGTTILGYVTLGIASGPAAIYTVPLALIADGASRAIEQAVQQRQINLENNLIEQTRGVRRKFGVGGIND